MLTANLTQTAYVEASLQERNDLYRKYFDREAARIAETARAMAERFLRGGRLLAFGKGAYATDAQHVAVEFVHPVIVGKRALPALDISPFFDPWPEVLVQPSDIVMGFGPPTGDAVIARAMEAATAMGAMTIALPGGQGSTRFEAMTDDPFRHQEMMEMLYHMLWETVHVFLEVTSIGYGGGQADFLYPFLADQAPAPVGLHEEIVSSIRTKVDEDARLRNDLASRADGMVTAAHSIQERLRLGGRLILFGNGGSATDANDWAIDCVAPPAGFRPIPAISLSMEPASISAVANDVGADLIFLRQLVAHFRPVDVAVAISTSGGSRNVVLALEEARKQGLLTIGLLGYDGGEVVQRKLVDHAIVVRSDYIPRIQEVQASVYHIIRELLEVRDGTTR